MAGIVEQVEQDLLDLLWVGQNFKICSFIDGHYLYIIQLKLRRYQLDGVIDNGGHGDRRFFEFFGPGKGLQIVDDVGGPSNLSLDPVQFSAQIRVRQFLSFKINADI